MLVIESLGRCGRRRGRRKFWPCRELRRGGGRRCGFRHQRRKFERRRRRVERRCRRVRRPTRRFWFVDERLGHFLERLGILEHGLQRGRRHEFFEQRLGPAVGRQLELEQQLRRSPVEWPGVAGHELVQLLEQRLRKHDDGGRFGRCVRFRLDKGRLHLSVGLVRHDGQIHPQ
ncbi:MAG: hypothetical protein JOZ69_03870 [Myxococcales bacterium]|nr:hypothetical protein [Myxococcales bacterium]